MRRALNVVSSVLILGGLALLVYVGVSYERSKTSTATSPNWSKTDRQKGRDLAKSLAHHQKVAIPTNLSASAISGREPATRMVIPKIALDAPVVQTAPRNGIWDVADWAVGHLTTTPNPGAPGNDALSAHDDIKGEVFKRLGELRPGDDIQIYTAHARYVYIVTSEATVDPSNVSVLNPTKASTVTLISCTPYWVDTQRLIVQGLLKTRTAV